MGLLGHSSFFSFIFLFNSLVNVLVFFIFIFLLTVKVNSLLASGKTKWMRNQIQARDWLVRRQPIRTQNKLLQLGQSKKQKFEIQIHFFVTKNSAINFRARQVHFRFLACTLRIFNFQRKMNCKSCKLIEPPREKRDTFCTLRVNFLMTHSKGI